ncbi:MAG: 50S ribosomal protein L10 [Acidobacteriota bacterium]|nr:50S ribosomal protein L10 [Acidobacteriota bacterium]
MKTREQKQKDLNALTEQLNNSKSAMVVSFNKVTVNKDQEFRHHLREAGAEYQVVKNTLARLAVKGTQFEGASEHFKGVTAIAWTESDPVILSKTISKFIKDNAELYTFKAGVVDGRVVDLKQVQAIAALPSKEELISKLLFVINAQAQRIVTVINAVPRNLAVVIKLIGEGKTDAPAEQKTSEPVVEEKPKVEEIITEETKPEETAQTSETSGATEENQETEQVSETEEVQAESALEIEQSSAESAGQEISEETTPEAEEEKSE